MLAPALSSDGVALAEMGSREAKDGAQWNSPTSSRGQSRRQHGEGEKWWCQVATVETTVSHGEGRTLI